MVDVPCKVSPVFMISNVSCEQVSMLEERLSLLEQVLGLGGGLVLVALGADGE